MTEIHWKTTTARREWLYVLAAASVALLIGAVLVASSVAKPWPSFGIGLLLCVWFPFAVYRVRPRRISLIGQSLEFNNLGRISLSGLQFAQVRRQFGEEVLVIVAKSKSRSIALHGVPEEIKHQLVRALEERIAT
jgi:hypothetical protein